MTPGEQIDYTRSDNGYMIPPQPKLGLPGTVTYDSSMAVHTTNPVPGTQFPSPSALAASWSINRAKEYGLAIGYETRELGGQQIIAPGLNLYRTPYGGRAGEYLSGEDPFIGSVLGPAVANGIQAQGVQTVAKHLVGNDQESNRHNVDIKVDERTLRELYLPAFESAVKNANVASVMCAFNKLNGEYACENHHLLTDILKNEWSFKGFVMTDYQGLQTPIKAALAGTDMEIGGGNFFTQANLLPFVESGEFPLALLNDKARRNLRALLSYGYDKGIPQANGIENLKHGGKASLNVAREGIVLLRNDDAKGGDKVLPLDPTSRIAVIGGIADDISPSPFGSHYSPPTTYVSELAGLRKVAGRKGQVDYLEQYSLRPAKATWYLTHAPEDKSGAQGLKAEYFNNVDLSGDPAVTRTEPGVNWDWSTGSNSTVNGVSNTTGFNPAGGSFSARFTGVIKPTVSGDQVFKIHADGAYRLWVNDELILESDGEPVALDLVYDPPKSGKAVHLKAGQEYSVKLEYRRLRGDFVTWNGGFTGIRMSWAPLAAPDNLKQYDAVVIAAGMNGEYEGEGFDHVYEMPEYQSDLIKNLSKANKNTVVVLHGGSAQKISPWVKKAGAVMHAWMPGQYGGQAVAEIIYGKVNPSGKLPISIDKDIEDNPAYASYPDIKAYQGPNAATEMTYSEGLYLGYRGYDHNHKKPLFPFGYGLSYSDFKYSDLKLSSKVLVPGQTINAQFKVTNTGRVAGYEIAQLYVSQKNSKVDRPVKELKGFDKIYLKPGQSKTVSIPLDDRSLAYFDEQDKSWQLDAGRFTVKVGSSSDDLPLSDTLTSLYSTELSTTTSNPLPKAVRKAVQVSASRAY
ncbi:glycosyl hydrolase, family 3 [Pseudomonas savastanoi pv. phaseolicola 1448A]|nr:glycosyl hydrolase, family 3 [Pseudomonas savastanoi pv. phaseolicola 1448A]